MKLSPSWLRTGEKAAKGTSHNDFPIYTMYYPDSHSSTFMEMHQDAGKPARNEDTTKGRVPKSNPCVIKTK